MEKKGTALFEIISFINKARYETTDTIIAKKILELRYELEDMSIEQLSQKCFISQSSVTRFIQKLGYNDFRSFKSSMNKSLYYLHRYYHPLKKEDITIEDIKNNVIDDIMASLYSFQQIDMQKVATMIQKLKEYSTIVFLGSELSMAITHLIQLTLIEQGKNVYTLFDVHYQKNMVDVMKEDVLIICISIDERWFQSFLREGKEELIRSKAYKVLWKVGDHHQAEDLFDMLCKFGVTKKGDINYQELMCFIALLNHAVACL